MGSIRATIWLMSKRTDKEVEGKDEVMGGLVNAAPVFILGIQYSSQKAPLLAGHCGATDQHLADPCMHPYLQKKMFSFSFCN